MDPIRPIGPPTGDELRVIPVAPARIRDRDARERDRRERQRAHQLEPEPQHAPDADENAPGHLDVQA